LAEAISALRRQDDPRAALALLDRHARAFPQARLGSEATRTRVEALVRLGDFETTLTLLDGMSDEAASLGADLLLTRAELRARGRRFRDALSDFTAVLEGTLGPLPAAAEERALYGRAVCLARLGRIEAARADLNSYAQRFPNGRFATEVRRLLAGEISPPQP
jgi:tetratricopeptide (TPR) repeat protein